MAIQSEPFNHSNKRSFDQQDHFSNDYSYTVPYEDSSRKLSGTDYQDMYNSIFEYFTYYIDEQPNNMSGKYFHRDIDKYVYEMAKGNFDTMFDIDIDCIIQRIVCDAGDEFFKSVIPRRVYADTLWCSRNPNIPLLEEKIRVVESRPQPDQRTEAWYTFRNGVLTASNAWKAFSTPGAVNQLIYEKCQPVVSRAPKINDLGRASVSVDTSLHWGVKYEPLSTMLYEFIYDTEVGEFGCVPHGRIQFLAASPDGINTKKTSSLYGRMLEIKNIVNREIDGNPKPEYWIQMQLQMEVCDLDDCDFLETRFVEYDSYEEFMTDSDPDKPFEYTMDGQRKGMFLYLDNNGIPSYYYPPMGCTSKEYFEWEVATITEYSDMTLIRTICWKLDEISCVLVLRNKWWFEYAERVLGCIWKTIQTERISGYEHRAPKKKPKLAAATKNPNDISGMLLTWEKDISGNYSSRSKTPDSVGSELQHKCLINIPDDYLN